MSFVKGESGNPAGRPKGASDRRRELRKLLEAQAEPLINKVVEAALQGDMQAMRLCIDRLIPKLSEDLVTLDFDGMDTARQLLEAGDQVCRAVLSGELTPTGGQALSRVLDNQRKLLELAEFEKRLNNLERRVDGEIAAKADRRAALALNNL